jgi:Cu/Ag efflux pump CusA
MGGMIAATLLGVFFIPLLYMAVRRWIARKRRRPGGTTTDAPHA